MEPLSHATAMQIIAASVLITLIVVLLITPREVTDFERPSILESYRKMFHLFTIPNFRIWSGFSKQETSEF